MVSFKQFLTKKAVRVVNGDGSIILWIIGISIAIWFVIDRQIKPNQIATTVPSDDQDKPVSPAIEKAFSEILDWTSRFESHCADQIKSFRWLNREFREEWNGSKPRSSFPNPVMVEQLSANTSFSKSDIERFRETWSLGVNRYCAQLNKLLMSAEREACKEFFRSIEKSPLTDEQVDASICFENRVNVVAAAGSGKTSLMVAKAGYAIHRQLVRPEKVLLLAFNKDAAEELRQRINRNLAKHNIDTTSIQVSTFHAFGLKMIGEITGKKPRVAEWVTTRSGEIEKASELVARLRKSDKSFAVNWVLLKTLFTSDFARFGDEDTADYWDPDTRKSGKRTLNNEVVKSEEERLIADWLYLHGVKYEYESTYEHDTQTAQHRQYTPDFFYPEIGVYHEHFALDSNGKPPPTFHGYLEGVLWKRKLHIENRTSLFETYSHEIRSREPFNRLESMLTERGHNLVFDADRPFIGREPIDDRLILNNLLAFLSHTKNTRSDISSIRMKLQGEKSDSWRRHSLFVDVFEKFYESWQNELKQNNQIDFHDMLCQAVDLIADEGSPKDFDLILVDEFQDSSVSRMEMVRALADRKGVQVTVVGDDWQSINRFAGADITIATKFSDYFGESLAFQLTRTFRCPSEICDVSSSFVMRNSQQLKKKVIGKPNSRDSHIRIKLVGKGISKEDSRERRLLALDEVLELIALDENRLGNDVLVLGRYNFEINDIPLPSDVTRILNVKKSTIHRSKGKEADHIIVVGMDSDNKYGFPSAVDDDPVLGLVMPKADALEFAEERRLFYVALTRAKETVYLLGSESTPSRFLAELTNNHKVPVISVDNSTQATKHCPRCNGMLVKKTNRKKGNDFLSCQRFPACKYAEPLAEQAKLIQVARATPEITWTNDFPEYEAPF